QFVRAVIQEANPSPLTQGRGLKHQRRVSDQQPVAVAPYAGAWIETRSKPIQACRDRVAPYAGAWIETTLDGYRRSSVCVGPYAGAWIETSTPCFGSRTGSRRPLRRGVD